MIARTLIILTTLLPIVLAGQTFKGELEMDSITGQYSYKTDCDDKLIITGEHMLIKKYKSNDSLFVALYFLRIDTIVQGELDSVSKKCNGVFVLINSQPEKEIIENYDVLLFEPIYHCLDSDIHCQNPVPFYYYILNGGINVRAENLNIKPCHEPGLIWPDSFLVRFSGPNNKKLYRNRFEKDIVKWRKKHCI